MAARPSRRKAGLCAWGKAVRELVKGEGAVGFLLPAPDKSRFFEQVRELGVLPRKTFSMGEANEKRYYMECRKK